MQGTVGGAFKVVGGAWTLHEKRPVEMGTNAVWVGHGTPSKDPTWTNLSSAHGGLGVH